MYRHVLFAAILLFVSSIALAAVEAGPQGLTPRLQQEVERDLSRVRDVVNRGDREARRLGQEHGLGTTEFRRALGEFQSRFQAARKQWQDSRAAHQASADTRFERQLRTLSRQTLKLLDRVRRESELELAALRVRSNLPARTQRAASVSAGGISGMVRAASDSTPLEAIQVIAFDENDYWVDLVNTDNTGYYEFPDLEDGTYFLKTYNYAGFIDKLYNNIECPGSGTWGDCDHCSGTPVVVSGGGMTTDINFRLRQGGSVSGKVTDANGGADLENVRVDIYQYDGTWMSFGTTGPDGTYVTLQGLKSGEYYAMTDSWDGYVNEIYDNIICSPPTWQCDPSIGKSIPVTTGINTPGIDFALEEGGYISGTIRDQTTGSDLEDVNVDIFNSSGDHVTYAFTDINGRYVTANGLPSGTYFARTYNGLGYIDELFRNIDCASDCDVTTGNAITVTKGNETSSIDFKLRKGGTISGTVTEQATGLPIESVSVDIYDSSGNWLSSGYTNSDGNFLTSAGLLAGNYYAATWNWSGYLDELYDNIDCSSGCDRTSGTSIAVTLGSETSGIDFALNKGGSISGTITDQNTGLPIENADITVFDASGSSVEWGYTDDAGEYVAEGLVTGTYYVTTWNYEGYLNELYNNLDCALDCDPTTGTPVAVTVGLETAGIDFALIKGGTISGTVTDQDTGLPIRNMGVDIYSSTGDWVTGGYSSCTGCYASEAGLPTGTYYAATYSWYSGYLDELYEELDCSSGCDPVTGTPIAVTQGAETKGIDFTLVLGGSISGTIIDQATGLPLGSVEVEVYNSSGDYFGYDYSDALGRYKVEGLPTGTYHATTYNWSGYLNELYNNLDCALGCDPTTGAAIAVTIGSNTTGINFALSKGGSISGTLTEELNGSPIKYVYVYILDEFGNWATYAYADENGRYTSRTGLPTGTYVAMTETWGQWRDELYDDIDCSSGCDVTTGTPIAVTKGVGTMNIDFALLPYDAVFMCNFEDGNTADWSAVKP